MPTYVKNNVVGQRVYDNGIVCEDVTKISLPTISHPTNTINSAGMVMDVDMPNTVHLDAMEFAVAHNYGKNCQKLMSPGKHQIEARIARQSYNVARGENELESVKVRVTGIHKSTEKGDSELGNPLGYTDKFSVLRYEEELAGELVTVIDAMAGIMKINGVDYASAVESLL